VAVLLSVCAPAWCGVWPSWPWRGGRDSLVLEDFGVADGGLGIGIGIAGGKANSTSLLLESLSESLVKSTTPFLQSLRMLVGVGE
jgi:hypothetical protein